MHQSRISSLATSTCDGVNLNDLNLLRRCQSQRLKHVAMVSSLAAPSTSRAMVSNLTVSISRCNGVELNGSNRSVIPLHHLPSSEELSFYFELRGYLGMFFIAPLCGSHWQIFIGQQRIAWFQSPTFNILMVLQQRCAIHEVYFESFSITSL